jgi:hypothetical protein
MWPSPRARHACPTVIASARKHAAAHQRKDNKHPETRPDIKHQFAMCAPAAPAARTTDRAVPCATKPSNTRKCHHLQCCATRAARASPMHTTCPPMGTALSTFVMRAYSARLRRAATPTTRKRTVRTGLRPRWPYTRTLCTRQVFRNSTYVPISRTRYTLT